jgi:outer membrane lipoprotein-sorting protein
VLRLAVATALLAWLAAGPSVRASTAAEEPLGAPGTTPGCATPPECYAQIAARQRAVRGLRADFRQTKQVALLREPLVSTGRLEYRAPDRVRWEVVSPEPLVVEIDGGAMRAGEPGKVEEVGEPGAAAAFRDLGTIFFARGHEATKRFAIEAGPGGPGSFALVPLEPSLRRAIAAVELTVDSATGVPRRAVLREVNGDRTEIELEVREVDREAPGGAQ